MNGPAKYERAFLETETDDNDLTYFLLYHAGVLERAIEQMQSYIRRKMEQVRSATADARGLTDLNHRQRSLLVEAMRHPGIEITIETHKRTFGVVTQTARTDLSDLVDRGYLQKGKAGRAFAFRPVPDLAERLKRA